MTQPVNSSFNLSANEGFLVVVPDGVNPKLADPKLGTKKYQVFPRDGQGTPVVQTDDAHLVAVKLAGSEKAKACGITDTVRVTDWEGFLQYRKDNYVQVAAFTSKTITQTYIPQVPVSEFSVHERLEMFREYLARIARRQLPGIVVIGNRGLGKSSNTTQIFEEFGLIDMAAKNLQGDFLVLKGSVSGPGLYQALYNCRNGGILVLDDCLLADDKCEEYLKAVLDTKTERRVTNGLFRQHDSVESDFNFQGHVVMISNLSEREIRAYLGERVPTINMWMTHDEILTYIETEIIPDSDVDPILLAEVFEYLSNNYKQLPEFNLRTWVHLLNERLLDETGDKWQKFAKFTCLRTSLS